MEFHVFGEYQKTANEKAVYDERVLAHAMEEALNACHAEIFKLSGGLDRGTLEAVPNPEYDGGDFYCPQCRSFEVGEIGYADDFGSMECHACGYQGDPGEDFPAASAAPGFKDAGGSSL